MSSWQIGTPICIPSREFIDIGRLASIENNHKPVDYAKKGQKVAIKVCVLELKIDSEWFSLNSPSSSRKNGIRDMDEKLLMYLTRRKCLYLEYHEMNKKKMLVPLSTIIVIRTIWCCFVVPLSITLLRKRWDKRDTKKFSCTYTSQFGL